MEKLYFENFEKFAHIIADKYNSLANDDKGIAIIAKYNETRKIIKELLCIGYNIRSINSLADPIFDGYDDEYIVSITNIDEENEIWCEPMKRNDTYIRDDSTIVYILGNSNSKVITYCNAEIIYEVNIEEEKYQEELEYTEHVCKDTYCKEDTIKSKNDNSTYCITIKGNLDMGDAEKIIENMERRIAHMQEMIDDMNPFRRLFMW